MKRCIYCGKYGSFFSNKKELWCCMICKQKFLEEYYSQHQLEVAIQNIK